VHLPRPEEARHHSQKKTLKYAEQLEPEIEQERQKWAQRVHGIGRDRFVFVDETNAKTTMTRLYGRAPVGERVVEYVPDGRWESLTLVAALSLEGATAALTYEGGTDSTTMLSFVEQVLVPTLKPGQIVVLDNLSSHKNADVIAAIRAAGADVWFLPRYSPDLNPIEEMWSKIKAWLRKTGARVRDALIDAIGTALRQVTQNDAKGWFNHCGYTNRRS
jgi:transposase